MSTTVTYKDNTLTTVNNATKTLKTAGKYMEDDITLVDDSDTGSVYQDQDGYLVVDDSKSPAPQGNVSITANGTYDVAQYAGASVNVEGNAPILQSKTATPSTLQQTITADSGYDGLSSVIVSAMPSGTEGTPTATKSSVSNHTISIIPSVTNTAGYISGGTQTGTAVSVSASELVSDTLSITANGTADVVNYANVNVNVSGGSSGGGNMSDPIRFFDYDGTLVASYSTVPESLPSIPTHSKLINGTWNYTLTQVAAQFNAMGTCDVGANYDTVSGATEIDIVLQEGRLHPYLSLAINGTVTIDWGDNSTDTATGTSLTSRKSDIHHEYATAGSYTIKITKTSGTGYSLLGTSVYYLLNKNSSTQYMNQVYSSYVQTVRVSKDCTIGSYAFRNCYSLTSVSIPSNITTIGNYAFSSCYLLTSVSIPSEVTHINTYAFSGCYSLTSISIPSGVTSIETYAFSNCSSLISVSIPSGVTSISTYAFRNCPSLAFVSIPSGVTDINNYTFYGCYSLTSVSVPSGVTSIGTNVFNGCYSLASISIPSGVTSIGTSAFNNCYSLVSISIPTGVTSISSNTFNNCYGIAEYHFEPITPPTLADINAFNNIPSDCIIYVPTTSLTAYQEAENWSTYASYMVGE